MPIIEKPWGHEELLEINNAYMVKKLYMKAGHRCSLQYHDKKRETIYVLSGQLKITSGPSSEELTSKIYTANQGITIAPKVVHRMEAIDDCFYLESSTPEMTDVIRLQDDYKRT